MNKTKTLFIKRTFSLRIATISRRFIRNRQIRGPGFRYIPPVLAVLAIPIVVAPIDSMADYILINTYRKWNSDDYTSYELKNMDNNKKPTDDDE